MTEETQSTIFNETETTQAQPAAPAETQQPEGQEQKTLLGEAANTETTEKAPEGQRTIPEKYELKAPEGMTINQNTVNALTPVLKKHSISQEAFQEISDIYAPIIKAEREAQHTQVMKDYDALTDGWRQETIKELGPDYAKKLAPASVLLDKYPEGAKVRELLEQTRLGNHPEMIKYQIWLGEKIRPDSFPDNNKTTQVDQFDDKLIFSSMKK